MSHKKVYVEVTVSFRPDGVILPREIVWEDGRHYDIDRVSDIRQSASAKVGGQGDRYTIIVNGKPKYLFSSATQASPETTSGDGLWRVGRSEYRGSNSKDV